ncbi:unnamed protein product [Phaedon cochleariae]|uniref:C3H1-type domain-containing protein n=1 Tax=Phaedon cochleariae TaxID=80249 RepID=A0A9P0DA37_PHACE|nr:unnamed protein product [Phaedon cochleariae]
MSDISDDIIHSDRNNEKDDNMCRDYVRGQCDRTFCKFKHDNEPRLLNFCHDFQNHVCPRPHCKFIHCSADDADEYKRTGQMSCQILTEATKKNQMPGALNICNQFRKGQCRRSNCKYRHITKEQEEAEVMELIQNLPQKQVPVVLNSNVNEGQIITLGSLNNVIRRSGVNFEEYQDEGLPLLKRRFITAQEHEILPCEIIEPSQARPVFKGYFAGNPPSPIWNRIDARSIMLEEENNILHKEIVQLKKQVSDLTATNEFLLDQNATLRLSGKRNVSAATAAQQQQQVNRTVIASVAAVPVSLATVSTCNAVSGNHSVSIAGCPTVSIAPAAPQLLANSQQILVTTNPSTQLAIANSSQAQLAIAQQNLANNLAAQQPQLSSQAQHLALATTTQQLTSQAQHMANHQQLALANTPQQAQQIALANNPQAQQLALANTSQQLSSQAQQLALASTNQQLTSQAQQLALANTTQQLSTQAQQLAMANTPQQLAVASVALAAGTNQQLIAQQNLATEMHRNSQMNAIQTSQALALSNATQPMVSLAAGANQQLIAQQNLATEMHRNNQMNAIQTSQAIAMSNATQPMVSFPIMTQTMSHALTH